MSWRPPVDGESLWPRLAVLSLVIEACGRPDGRPTQQPAAARPETPAFAGRRRRAPPRTGARGLTHGGGNRHSSGRAPGDCCGDEPGAVSTPATTALETSALGTQPATNHARETRAEAKASLDPWRRRAPPIRHKRTPDITDEQGRSLLGALTEGREAASTKAVATASTLRLPLQACCNSVPSTKPRSCIRSRGDVRRRGHERSESASACVGSHHRR